jgi:hypothetical protein
MKIILLFLLSFLFFASPLFASTLTMCPGGGVKSDDSTEAVEEKCGKAQSSSMTLFRIENKPHMLETKRIIFKDGTDILFVFVDKKVVSSQNLN